MYQKYLLLVVIVFTTNVQVVEAGWIGFGKYPTVTTAECTSAPNNGTCRTRGPGFDGCTLGTDKFIGFCDINNGAGCCIPTETLINSESSCQAAAGQCSIDDANCFRLNTDPKVKYDPIGYCDGTSERNACCKIGAATGGSGATEYCENTLKGVCLAGKPGQCSNGGSEIGICGADPENGSPRICCSQPSSTTPTSRGRLDYKLLEEIPGSTGNDGDLSVYVGRLYTFTFWAVGIAAVFMLTVGGFLYATAAGNTSRAETAKTIVTDSLLGIIVAVFSWLFLYIINPDLVENLPLIGTVVTPRPPVTPPTTTITCGSPPTPMGICCPKGGGINCFDCQGCVAIPDSVPKNTCNLSTCFLNSALLSKIQSISGVSGWKITESWPPTAKHINPCHAKGTCADMNNSGGPTDPPTIKSYYDAFRAAGLNVLYENKTDCGPYTALGIRCQSYPHQTNNSSFHVW